ncbi:MAG: hypothetical protein E6I60_16285 [Chloroflexi bacterium]|nr:MAG: hypothetical protein E6I60_16285 [Chloroflexota bacterium]
MSEAARPSEHAVKQPSTELAQRHGTEHESAPPVVDALFERTPLASNATRRQFLAGPPPLEPEGFGSMRGVSARTLLGLQRSAGNAAVTAFLMRSPERPSGGATTAEREPAAGESPRATGPPPAAARVPAPASAVGMLLQRKPPAAPAAPAPAAAPAKSPAEIAQMVSDSLDERYKLLKEASSQMTWDLSSDRGGPDSSPGPAAAKHTIVGGPAELATKWTGIQDHILKASSGKAPFVALEGLYSTEGMADVKALKPAARQQVADLVRQLLITYATDDQLTGKPTDVETIVNEITSSFWQTYESAGGAAAGPEHIAVPGANSPLFYVKDKWPQIDAQIRKPKQRIESADELMHVVYVGTVPDQLALLQPAERVQVSTTVFDRLTRIASDEGQSGASIEQDWAQLQPPLRGAIENDKAGLVFVRGPLLNTFGSFAAANAFYQALTTATFAGYTGKFIHPALAALITKADATLKQLDPSGALNGSVDFGGLSVRENRNQKTKLSNHSFVDLQSQYLEGDRGEALPAD